MSNMVVRTNVFALNAHRNMKNVGLEQQRASNRLASGFRINSAADDAAGLAISETMRAQIRGLDQASRNSQDGQALVQVAEGGMQEIQNMFQRIRELLVQASNDTNAESNRNQIQLEIKQLLAEVDSMAQRIEFNGMRLLTGDFAPGAQGITFTIGEGFDAVGLLDGFDPDDLFTGLASPTNDDLDAIDAFFQSPAFNALINRVSSGSDVTADDVAALVAVLEGSDPTNENVIADEVLTFVQDVVDAILDAAPRPIAADDLADLTEGTKNTSGLNDDQKAALVAFLNDPANLEAIKEGAFAADDPAVVALAGSLGGDLAVAADLTVWLNDNAEGILTIIEGTPIDGVTMEQAVGAELHLQIGANSNQSMLVNIANMRLEALVERAATSVASQDREGAADLAALIGGFVTGFNVDGAKISGEGHLFQLKLGGDLAASGSEITPLIDGIQAILDEISLNRAELGAISNRLDFTMRSLDISSENLSDAESRVRNADMAREMMRFTMSNVLQQASVSMLAQANQLPNNLLQLLR